MNSVAVIGHFAFDKEYLDGQTVKTKMITAGLEEKLGNNEVLKHDTHARKSKILLLPFQLFAILKKSNNIVILPAQNGVRIIAPLLALENLFFKRKLHYIVIGGWLPQFLDKKPVLKEVLKCFDYIYVETKTMKQTLETKTFQNIEILPNCKKLDIIQAPDVISWEKEPYRFCTFSRVMKEKGIEDAIEAITFVNKKHEKNVCVLDIYGQIAPTQKEWFDEIMSSAPEYVQYKGLVPFDKSVEVLKKYFALIFPTKFYTEGIPGTIIDAYAAGLPVISSRWESFFDIIDENVTGLGYDFLDVEDLKRILNNIIDNPAIINSMKINCLEKAENYVPKKTIDNLIKNFG